MFRFNKFQLIFITSLVLCASNLYAQYHVIVPETWSYRLDPYGDQLFENVKGDHEIVSSHYYGYPDGGMTAFDSSPFEEYSYFDNPFDNYPLYSWNHRLNFRFKKPEEYNADDTTKLYPMIVFMHGAGERGNCWSGNCWDDRDPTKYFNNDHQLYHGGLKHLLAVQEKFFDGFLLYPQNRNSWFYPDRFAVVDIIEKLIKTYHIDPSRIYIHGLSNGGNATWQLISYRPDLFAAAISTSGKPAFRVGADPTSDEADPEKMLHIPTWHFQGSNDSNPSQAFSEANLNVLKSYGGTPKYTLLQGIGHGTWNIAYSWGEDIVKNNYIDTTKNEFFPWFLQYSKLTIHPYYGITEVCEGDPVNIRMGISPGFQDYEWKKIKNGIESEYPSDPAKPNEIVADEIASYEVRYKQYDKWTEWSKPLTITSKPRPMVTVEAQGSTYFPAPDNSTYVVLATNATGSYQWFRNGSPVSPNGTNSNLVVNQDTPGEYQLVVNNGTCDSSPSDPIYVKKQPYTNPLPSQPTGLTAIADSEKSIVLTWDNQDDERGFELFRATSPGGTYTFVERLPKNAIYFKDQPLSGSTTYYYILRAFNENGASANTPEVSVATLADIDPPSAPMLAFDGFGYTENRDSAYPDKAQEWFDTNLDEAKLSWTASTDNAAIDEYRVYFSDGTLAGTTTDTTLQVSGLQEKNDYQFYVQAVDLSGNVSTPSNTINVNTVLDGLYFHIYAGNTWKLIKDFSIDSYWYEQGTVDNFDIGIRPDYYGDDDYFAFDFFGFIYIENEGDYTFYTKSDDGSQLFIDGTMVVDNDGRHGNRERPGNITLSPGAHYITVKFFEATGGQNLIVSWDPPGSVGKQLIPNSVLRSYDNYSTGVAPAAASNLIVAQTPTGQEPNTVFGLDLTWDHNNPLDVVVLGSSTAEGTGATPGNSWVESFTSWLQGINASSTVTNLAKGGYTSYHIQEDGNTPGGGKPLPDPARNITAALNVPGVDMIIVNLPSNDIASGFTEAETMTNLKAVRDVAEANGVKIFFTTTQPRTEFVLSKRQELAAKAASIRQEFKEYTIDIYDELADDQDNIKPEYAYGDEIHLNDAGHNYIFNETVATLTSFLPRFEVYRGESPGAGKEIVKTTLENSYSDLNLSPSTLYYYQVRAINSYGASTFTSEVSGTTVADNSNPTAPSSLTVLSYNENSVALGWTASSDNVGVAGYNIYVNGESHQQNLAEGRKAGKASRQSAKPAGGSMQKLMGSASTTALVTGLNPGTDYEFTVSAFDEALNPSSLSIPITQTTLSAPLPIEMVDFSYVKQEDAIQLYWKTASELNNDFFTVERSKDANDFEVLGTLNGAGNSNEMKEYSFADTDPMATNYYRVKQTDFNGDFEYSRVIKVDFTRENDWVLYPNPTTANNVNILVKNNNDDTTVNIKIVDLFGRVVFDKGLDISGKSTFSYQLDLPDNLSTGIYNLIFQEDNQTINRKLVLK